MNEHRMIKKPDLTTNETMKPAGLYIHIPYCKRKCTYCNFHFSTNLSTKHSLLNALIKEIELRAEEASPFLIQSIYLGGGTPSLLKESELIKLFQTIQSNYKFDTNPEITLEANPDDINDEYMNHLNLVGINRLSIGVQSFFDKDLSWMNRAHNAHQSFESIEMVIKAGFKNFSIDLMYGLPDINLDTWTSNLNNVLVYDIPHISCYALTIEERTALSEQVKQNKIIVPEDSYTLDQMDVLLDFCEVNNYEPYEISNFAKSGFRSKHNSAYWDGIPYFGFGPAAHSYINDIRRWNVANNSLYIQAIENKLPYFETEILSRKDKCNEYLMLQLRRIEGLSVRYLEKYFEEFSSTIKLQMDIQMERGNINFYNGKYVLSRKGRYIADEISSSLFVL